jgi:hypothetical protein
MMRFLSRALGFLFFPFPLSVPLFALDLPRTHVADALLGMVNIDLLLLPRVLVQHSLGACSTKSGASKWHRPATWA